MNSSATRRRLTIAFASGAAIFAFGMSAPAMADPGNGANSGCGAYCPTNAGDPTGNGNGNGNKTGQPGAGTVGNADDKNPPGQSPDGTDGNNGYECDGNQGVGKTNPAHTGCQPRTS